MGKPGGFFKKLKAKQKAQEKRRSRGTTGAKKEERRRKREVETEVFAAKRQVRELDAISSSSDEDSEAYQSDVDSEDERLNKLRTSLHCAPVEPAKKAVAKKRIPDEDGLGSLSEDDEALISDDDEEVSELDDIEEEDEEEDFDDEDDEEEEMVDSDEEAEFEEGDDELLDDEEEMEEDEEDFDDGNPEDLPEIEMDEDELLAQAEDDDEFVFDAEEDEEWDEEDEEEELTGEDDLEEDEADELEDDGDDEAIANTGESAFNANSDEDEADDNDAEDEAHVMLKNFDFSTSDAQSLEGVVHKNDPWLAKYHLDTHGEIDETPIKDVSDEVAKQPANAKRYAGLTDCGITIKATTHARKNVARLAKPPSAFPGVSVEEDGSVSAASAPPPFINETLWGHWVEYRQSLDLPILTAAEFNRLTMMTSYADVLDNTTTLRTAETHLDLSLLHLLNHWMKARSVTLAHNQMLKNIEAAEGEEPELRDRGFGKTRLMLVLPMRNAALKAVNALCRILGLEPHEQHKYSLFERDFSEIEEAVDPTFKRRPRDYQKLFEGNIDDMFCFGVSLKPNRVNLYSHVLNSDLIICSPLGLRRRMMKNADCSVALASIEVCVVHDAHVIMMQNWQHMEAVFRLLNKRPKDTTEGLSEISRIYSWALEGHSGRHRQTIMHTEIANATINATARSFFNNTGRFVLANRTQTGVLQHITHPIRQHFVRFDVEEDEDNNNAVENVDDARFEFFAREIYPSKIQPLVDRNVRTIIFVPSYFDYIRVRNYLHAEHREFYAELCEYTPLKEQRRALGQFTDGERSVLITTERFYFFKRYFVKLAECLVFYSPPVFPDYYQQLIHKLQHESPNTSVMSMYCKYDALELQRVVGTERALQLLTREADAYAFVTGGTN